MRDGLQPVGSRPLSPEEALGLMEQGRNIKNTTICLLTSKLASPLASQRKMID